MLILWFSESLEKGLSDDKLNLFWASFDKIIAAWDWTYQDSPTGHITQYSVIEQWMPHVLFLHVGETTSVSFSTDGVCTIHTSYGLSKISTYNPATISVWCVVCVCLHRDSRTLGRLKRRDWWRWNTDCWASWLGGWACSNACCQHRWLSPHQLQGGGAWWPWQPHQQLAYHKL